MSGEAITIEAPQLAELAKRLRALSRADRAELARDLAAAGESATRARLQAGGPAPDGGDWPERKSGGSKPLLNRGGGLVDSIDSSAAGARAEWGSNLIYARIHQLGGDVVPVNAKALRFPVGPDAGGERQWAMVHKVTIPPRPYLGWGPDERRFTDDVVTAWLERAA